MITLKESNNRLCKAYIHLATSWMKSVDFMLIDEFFDQPESWLETFIYPEMIYRFDNAIDMLNKAELYNA